jgi:hypothetical protein
MSPEMALRNTLLVKHGTSAREDRRAREYKCGESEKRARKPTFPVRFWLVHVLSNKARGLGSIFDEDRDIKRP